MVVGVINKARLALKLTKTHLVVTSTFSSIRLRALDPFPFRVGLTRVRAMGLPKRLRHDGPFSMDLLHDPRGWSLSLLKNALVWEIPRQCITFFVKSRCAPPKGVAPTPKQKEFMDCASSYVVSAVHAVVTTGLGIRIMATLWNAPTYDKFYVNEFTTDFAVVDLIERTNWLFFGYMMDDLAHVLVQYPKLGKMDMVAHHLVFITAAVLAGGAQIYMFQFSWLIVGEASTPLLTVKWFMRQASSANSPALVRVAAALRLGNHTTCASAAAALELFVAKIFIVVFFLVRVLAYGGGLAHTARHMRRGDFREIPTTPTHVVFGIILAGAGLNAMWFRLMMMKALGLGKYRAKTE